MYLSFSLVFRLFLFSSHVSLYFIISFSLSLSLFVSLFLSLSLSLSLFVSPTLFLQACHWRTHANQKHITCCQGDCICGVQSDLSSLLIPTLAPLLPEESVQRTVCLIFFLPPALPLFIAHKTLECPPQWMRSPVSCYMMTHECLSQGDSFVNALLSCPWCVSGASAFIFRKLN